MVVSCWRRVGSSRNVIYMKARRRGRRFRRFKLTLICMNSVTSEINLMATVSNNTLHNRHSDLSSDQAAPLRDIARNGSADEGSLYGFNDVGHNGQPNGAAPQLEL